jgi:hypothetical protein
MLNVTHDDILNVYKLENDRINSIANIKRNFAQITYNWLRENPNFDYVIQDPFLDTQQTNTSDSTSRIYNGKMSAGTWKSIVYTFPVNVNKFKFIAYQNLGITFYVNSTQYSLADIDKTLTLSTATNSLVIQINAAQETYMFFMMAFQGV